MNTISGMKMRVSRSLVAVFLLLIIPAGVVAQSGMTGDLTVRSDPQGAMVKLKGGATVSGVTPARFRHLLIGGYELTLKKRGFETYKTNIDLDPTKQMEMDIRLAPKTRFKTVVRSMFIPGWGQWYADRKLKGVTFASLTVMAGIGYLIADNERGYRNDEFIRLRDEFDSLSGAGDIEEAERIYPDLKLAIEKKDDAEKVRNVVLGIGVGIWSLNVIDALFFCSERRGTFTVKGLSVTPSADINNVELKLSMDF